MTNGSFKIEGAQELQAALLGLPDKVAKNLMKDALVAGAEIIMAKTKSAVRVRTGETKEGIQIVTSNAGGAVSVFVTTGVGNKQALSALRKIRREAEKSARIGGKSTEHSRSVGRAARKDAEKKMRKQGINTGSAVGVFLERGTKHMAARPFMGPSLESGAEEATNAIAAKLKAGIEESFKGS